MWHVTCRYSCEEVYDVVADVDSYKLFLPWCQESRYVRRDKTKSIAKLNIGFPPLTESYTALVLSEHPHFIRVSLVLSEHPTAMNMSMRKYKYLIYKSSI